VLTQELTTTYELIPPSEEDKKIRLKLCCASKRYISTFDGATFRLFDIQTKALIG